MVGHIAVGQIGTQKTQPAALDVCELPAAKKSRGLRFRYDAAKRSNSVESEATSVYEIKTQSNKSW
jgi:hypothetical protein